MKKAVSKTVKLNIPTSDAEYEMVQRAAKAVGMEPKAWMREVIERHVASSKQKPQSDLPRLKERMGERAKQLHFESVDEYLLQLARMDIHENGSFLPALAIAADPPVVKLNITMDALAWIHVQQIAKQRGWTIDNVLSDFIDLVKLSDEAAKPVETTK